MKQIDSRISYFVQEIPGGSSNGKSTEDTVKPAYPQIAMLNSVRRPL